MERDVEKRNKFVNSWRTSLSLSDPAEQCVIIFRDGCSNYSPEKGTALNSYSIATFVNAPDDGIQNLLFSGSEFDRVLIIFDSNASIRDSTETRLNEEEHLTKGQIFGQNLLIATSRARKSLTFVVANEQQKAELESFRSDENSQLIVAQMIGNEQREQLLFESKLSGRVEDICEVLRISVHREHIPCLNRCLEAIERRHKQMGDDCNSNISVESVFVAVVLPACIGRKKSEHFLGQLGQFVKSRRHMADMINDCSNTDAEDKFTRWTLSAYCRGRVEALDWRMQFPAPNLPAGTKVTLFKGLLTSAMREGSLKVVEHAFEKASKFLKVPADDISGLIVSQSFDIDLIKQQSLLSIATRTNKDHELVRYLLTKMREYDESSKNANMRANILKQAIEWSVQYRSFLMLRTLIAEKNEQHFDLLVELLKELNLQPPRTEACDIVIGFIARVERFAEWTEKNKGRWKSEEETKLIGFIRDLSRRLQNTTAPQPTTSAL